MAAGDYALTVVDDFVANYDASGFDKNEYRDSNTGGIDLIEKQTNSPQSFLSSEVKEKISQAMGISVNIPVIDFRDVTIGNVRTCAFQEGGPTSRMISVTGVTYTFGFAMNPAQHLKNHISYEEAYAKNMLAANLKLKKVMDSATINLLETNKNQVAGNIAAYYPFVGNAVQVPQGQKEWVYNNIPSIFEEMDFSDEFDVLANPRHFPDVRKGKAQGGSNDENEQFQYAGIPMFSSNRVTNGVGVQSTAYAVQPGNIAWHSRINPISDAGYETTDGKIFRKVYNPIIGKEMELIYQSKCSDESALATLGWGTAVPVESFQFAFEVFYMKAWNADLATNASPILKVEIMS